MKVTVKPFLFIRDALGDQREIEVKLNRSDIVAELFNLTSISR